MKEILFVGEGRRHKMLDAILEEIRAMEAVWFRPYELKNNTITVLHWSESTSYEYDSSRIFDEKFETEKECIKWINENIKTEYIDPEYRKVSREDYMIK
jgi:hypothetical protein